MSIPVLTIDSTGAHLPDYETVRAWVVSQFQAIYGADIYVEPDSQDGQLIALFAQSIHDANSVGLAVYNSRGPSTAQGEGLSSIVKINGLTRQVATFSTVDLRIVGEVGAVITNGAVTDVNGNRWLLPTTVVIPIAGEITVTATAAVIGAVTAIAHTITNIQTPTRGWQTVDNPSDAVAGAPVEKDAALKARQAISTEMPANTPAAALKAVIAAILGVTRVQVYENDTDVIDANGQSPHSIACVVEGGDSTALATAIALKKNVGAGTYGSSSVSVNDAAGVPRPIRFSRPTNVEIEFAITIKALPGYSSARSTAIKDALIAWLAAENIGDDVIYTRSFLPANLYGDPLQGAGTFQITSLTMRRGADPFAAADITIAFNEAAFSQTSGITITVT